MIKSDPKYYYFKRFPRRCFRYIERACSFWHDMRVQEGLQAVQQEVLYAKLNNGEISPVGLLDYYGIKLFPDWR